MGQIYLVQNKINKKRYIGQTVCGMRRRKSQHEKDSQNGSNLVFHKALRKYGFDNFEWKILFYVEKERLNTLEIVAIRMLKTLHPNGYNLLIGGSGGVSDETRMKMSKTHKKKCEDKEYIDAVIKRLLIGGSTPEAKEKHKKATIEAMNREEVRNKCSENMKIKWKDGEFRKQMMAKMENVYSRPEVIEKMSLAAQRKRPNRQGVSTSLKGKSYMEIYGSVEKVKEEIEKRHKSK